MFLFGAAGVTGLWGILSTKLKYQIMTIIMIIIKKKVNKKIACSSLIVRLLWYSIMPFSLAY